MEGGPLARWGLLGTALALGVVLILSALANWQSARSTASQAARAHGDVFLVAIVEMARGREGPLGEADLKEILEEQTARGLRYLAIARPDGEILVEVGQPEGIRFLRPGTFEVLGSVVRTTAIAGRGRMPPRADGRRPHRPPLVVMEYEPLLANRLRSGATQMLGVSLIGALLLLTLIALFWRASIREEHSQRQLAAQRRLAALGEMSAVLAHEIRNPLASLKGHAQLLEESLLNEERARSKVRRVIGEAERLEVLVAELLEFVRVGEIDRTYIDVSEMLAGTVARALVPTEIEGEGPARWSLDGPRMQRVLDNLLDNAAAVTPDGGRVVLSSWEENGELRISVADQGPGIPDPAKIFEPFYTTKTRGVGLGLAVCRRIVEQHQGRIWADNPSSGGGRITIAIPAT